VAGVSENGIVSCGASTCGGDYEVNAFTACSNVDQVDIDADQAASGYATAAADAISLIENTYMPLVTSSF